MDGREITRRENLSFSASCGCSKLPKRNSFETGPMVNALVPHTIRLPKTQRAPSRAIRDEQLAQVRLHVESGRRIVERHGINLSRWL